MIKDNCKHLTMTQVERLIERDGLGRKVEYSLDALKARHNQLAMKQANKIERTEWDNVDPSLYKSSGAIVIESALEHMTVTELATILKCSRAAISLWRKDQRPVPKLVQSVIALILARSDIKNYFLSNNLL